MTTTAFLSGRAGGFVSSGGLLRHGGITRTASARSLAMAAAGEEKVGFIGERSRVMLMILQRAAVARGVNNGTIRWMKRYGHHGEPHPAVAKGSGRHVYTLSSLQTHARLSLCQDR